jgi:hypothetical protein
MTGQPSEVEAFSGITKRFFWVLIPVSSVIDAGASYSFRLPINPGLNHISDLFAWVIIFLCFF